MRRQEDEEDSLLEEGIEEDPNHTSFESVGGHESTMVESENDTVLHKKVRTSSSLFLKRHPSSKPTSFEAILQQLLLQFSVEYEKYLEKITEIRIVETYTLRAANIKKLLLQRQEKSRFAVEPFTKLSVFLQKKVLECFVLATRVLQFLRWKEQQYACNIVTVTKPVNAKPNSNNDNLGENDRLSENSDSEQDSLKEESFAENHSPRSSDNNDESGTNPDDSKANDRKRETGTVTKVQTSALYEPLYTPALTRHLLQIHALSKTILSRLRTIIVLSTRLNDKQVSNDLSEDDNSCELLEWGRDSQHVVRLRLNRIDARGHTVMGELEKLLVLLERLGLYIQLKESQIPDPERESAMQKKELPGMLQRLAEVLCMDYPDLFSPAWVLREPEEWQRSRVHSLRQSRLSLSKKPREAPKYDDWAISKGVEEWEDAKGFERHVADVLAQTVNSIELNGEAYSEWQQRKQKTRETMFEGKTQARRLIQQKEPFQPKPANKAMPNESVEKRRKRLEQQRAAKQKQKEEEEAQAKQKALQNKSSCAKWLKEKKKALRQDALKPPPPPKPEWVSEF
eukprot:GCRY01003576.1.p1 GENE.GCRY01003576.1~~GCRY01003576.1.p1  ORF type:complete len:568 (+),score=79.61 GCRY01003576.1:111-1814(+)